MDQLTNQILQATKIIEQQVDQQITEYNNLDEDGIEEIRRKRMIELKEQQKKKEEWLRNRHGEYEELSNENEFFEAAKASENLVCHFYKPDVHRCKVVDKLLRTLASKYIGTKFIYINCERVPFLVKRLKLQVVPTIGISIKQKMVDYIRVSEELGDNEDIPLELLEERLALSSVINMVPKKKPTKATKTKIIRGKMLRDYESDDDI
ncbi:TXNDC9 protein [Strongyloides ratti]|uniref:TXNDC9 protein n=1 Tax=Strongyloides ratti TaxID=34506 RepID=A0A090LC07_STRRB|nr:TXNDC9 protein [Strongyloides ratti]CEF67321.1 TXNDC9 protein [Strongyloides ratti]